MVDLGCPKRMQFGPCGGVRPDGQCEMRSGPCSFPELVPWPYAAAQVAPVPAPLILTDFSCAPFDAADVASTAATLAPSCDAVLVGEHQNRPDFPPTVMSRLLIEQGVQPWITLSCRDRNRIVLEQELRGLRFNGATTVFCVTGDGRGYDVRADVTQTFDLDGPRLVALAASLDMIAAVPETPTAPPVHARAARLVEKQRAGASVAVLNHVSSAAALSAFYERRAFSRTPHPGAGRGSDIHRRDIGCGFAGPARAGIGARTGRRSRQRARSGRGRNRGSSSRGARTVGDKAVLTG